MSVGSSSRCGISSNISLYLCFTVLLRWFSWPRYISVLICCLTAATTSTSFTSSKKFFIWHFCSAHTSFNSATISFQSSLRSWKISFNFFFGGFSLRGGVGFNRSNPVFLSTAVQAVWSTTILLCAKKGIPSITGAQRDREITA